MMLIFRIITLYLYQGLCLDVNATSFQVLNMTVPTEELLDKLCPSVDICNVNATTAEIPLNGLIGGNRVSCCTGCSCHPDCKERSNCCFPDNNDTDTRIEHSTSKYQCLKHAIGNPDEVLPVSVPAYLTVASTPAGGCISKEPVEIEHGLMLHPLCDNSFDIRSYFPVYSKTTRDVYKNMQCAICHGIKDARYLKPEFICRKGRRTGMNKISEISYLIDTGMLPAGCYVLFRFNEPRLLSQKRCYHSVLSSCQKDSLLRIPRHDIQDLDMSLVQVLCENGVYSPFPTKSQVYKNVFCYLCGQRLQEDGDLICRYDGFERADDTAYISLLNPNVYPGQPVAGRQGYYPEACLELRDETYCYRINCPLGKTMDKDGRCVFISNFLKSPLYLYIKLLPMDDYDLLEKIKSFGINELRDVIIQNNPWSKDWVIQFIYVREGGVKCKEKAFILIDLMSKKTTLSIFISKLEYLLSLPWKLNLYGTILVFKQSLREYELRGSEISQVVHINHPFLGCDHVPWRTIIVNIKRFNDAPIMINKLYLCKQIQIGLGYSDRVRYGLSFFEGNVTKRVLARFEFELMRQEDEYQAKVCLEDTVLQRKPQNDGTRLAEKFICLMFVLHILSDYFEF